MAEVTGLRNNALPYPVYGVPWGVVFPMLDADGDLVTGATTPDAEVSKNGDTFADCTNESTEIDTASGMYYLLLTGTEMTADVVALILKSATAGMKTTPVVLYPKKLPTLRSGTSQAGAATTITLDAGASAIDDYYNGCLIIATLDGAVEARIIGDYNGTTKVATIEGPNWNTTPDSDDTFVIKLPDGVAVVQANATHVGSTAQAAVDIATRIGAPAGASIAADIADVEGKVDDLESRVGTPSDLGSGATLAANLVDVEGQTDNLPGIETKIDALPTAAGIADAVWDEDATGHQTQGTFGQAIGDPAADANTIYKAVVTDAAGATVGVDLVDVEGKVDDLESRLGTPSDLGSGASVAANLVDIEGQTDDLGVAGAGLTAVPWNAAWDAEVQSEVDDALVARNLDKLILASGTADSGSTTTMVDAARTEGDADYWKGRLIVFTSGNIAGQCAVITDFNAGTDTFTFAPPLTQAVGVQTYVILPGISVWDDTLAEHLIAGSTGSALNAAGAAGDPWSTALPGAYGAGTAGKIVGDNINATVSSRASQASVDVIDDFLDTEVADIQSRLPAALTAGGNMKADMLAISGDSVAADNLEAAADGGSFNLGGGGIVAASVAGNVGGNVTGSVGSLAAQAKADVQAEAEDALVVHRLDELLNADSDIDGAAPPTLGSVFHELLTKTAGSFTYDQTTDSLEAVRDNMGTPQTGDSFARLGAPAGASVSADIADVEGKVDDLESRVGVPSNLGGGATLAANLADIEGQTDDIGAAGAGLTALGDARLANLDATVSTRATPAQVNAEVVDVITVDTQAEPATIPAANAPLSQKIGLAFMRARNKQTLNKTTGVMTLFDDSNVAMGTGTDSDDGTTFTKGKVS